MRDANRVIDLQEGTDYWFVENAEDKGTRFRKRKRYKQFGWRWPMFLVSLVLVVSWISMIIWVSSMAGNHNNQYPVSGLDTPAMPCQPTGQDEEPYADETHPGAESNSNTAWNLTLVNRENPISEDYEVNLVDVPGGEQVDSRIYDPLMQMLNAAEAENLGPIVVSGFRTEEKQQNLYDEKIQKYKNQGYSQSEAVELAEQWVATPGTSEHQLGLAVDINGATYDIYLWLQANSYRYGFIFRYPGSKSEITGVAEEVWHYRYVGLETATEIYERGICLEEYVNGAQVDVPINTSQKEDAWYRDGDGWQLYSSPVTKQSGES